MGPKALHLLRDRICEKVTTTGYVAGNCSSRYFIDVLWHCFRASCWAPPSALTYCTNRKQSLQLKQIQGTTIPALQPRVPYVINMRPRFSSMHSNRTFYRDEETPFPESKTGGDTDIMFFHCHRGNAPSRLSLLPLLANN